jgi:hypothetical protein
MAESINGKTFELANSTMIPAGYGPQRVFSTLEWFLAI